MLCPEAERRQFMDDETFWNHVFQIDYSEPEEFDDVPTDGAISTPCPVCGSTTECGYDSEGRPMIHTVAEDTDED